MPSFPTVVRGFVTQLCPLGDRLYFQVSGDESSYGFNESHYNVTLYQSSNFQASYELLLQAAEHHWEVIVQRSADMGKHKQMNRKWTHYKVD